MKCDKFDGEYTCKYFHPNGACTRPDKFMCEIFIDTNSQPVADDVPLYVGMVLKSHESATVTEIIRKKVAQINKQYPVKQQSSLNFEKRSKMEEYFGKI